MEDPRIERMERLGEAIDAYLRFRASAEGADAAAFLAENEPLRDVLEPMFTSEAEGVDVAPELPRAPLDAEQVFGDYRIVREIGRGGMGTVFEAVQISLSRRVALKILHRHLACSARSIERFRAEATAAARLRHPAIVPIHEVGEIDGLHYFSMDYVEGVPLSQQLVRGELGDGSRGRAASAADIVAQVAEALQFAHDRGIVHRDVKPHNILITQDASVRLLDFGLAKMVDHAASVTGDILGTPHYMSPEQASGSEAVGPRSDVFSLGVVLYELLAGERPFVGDTPHSVLRRIETQDPAPLAKVASVTPRDLQTICHKAIEKDPANRYATAGGMAGDLRRFLRFEPILAQPIGPVARVVEWARSNRLVVALGSLGLVVAIGVGIAFAWERRHSEQVVREEQARKSASDQLAFRGVVATLVGVRDRVQLQAAVDAGARARLENALALCDEFVVQAQSDPAMAERAAEALAHVVAVHRSMGRADAAERAARQALDLIRGVPGRDPSRGLVEVAFLHELMVIRQLESEGGETEFEAARGLLDDLADDVVNSPVNLARFRLLAERGGHLCHQAATREAGYRMLEDAMASDAVDVEALAPGSATRTAAAFATSNVAHYHMHDRQFGRARELLVAALADLDGAEDGPRALGLKLRLQSDLVSVCRRTGGLDEADRVTRERIALAQRMLAVTPGSSLLREHVLAAYVTLATHLLGRGRIDEALPLREPMLEYVEPWLTRVAALDNRKREIMASVHQSVATLTLLGDNTPEGRAAARTSYECARAIYKGLAAEKPRSIPVLQDLGGAANNLAALANEEGDRISARQFAREAIEYQTRALEIEPRSTRTRQFLGMHYSELAVACEGLGVHAEAMRAAREAAPFARGEPATLRKLAELAAREFLRVEEPVEKERSALDAVEWLAALHHANPEVARAAVRSADFEALAGRDDFQRLRARIDP